ncbi:hypothetical protein [Streptomyces sp. NPDC052496]
MERKPAATATGNSLLAGTLLPKPPEPAATRPDLHTDRHCNSRPQPRP